MTIEQRGSKPAAAGSSTVVKGVEMLRTVADFPHGGTAAQLAEASGHPFSTAYRLLNTLVDTGFVEFDQRSKTYVLGLPVFELGQRVAHARGYSTSASPALQNLTARTHESSILAVIDGTETLTVHAVDGPQFRTTTNPGDRGPLNTSAMGKALLAWQDAERRAWLLDHMEFARRTPRSITDPAALTAQLDQARERGWCEQSEEQDTGMNAIAVPVLRPDGAAIAALAVAAPVFRADMAALREFLPEMRQAAERLGSVLP